MIMTLTRPIEFPTNVIAFVDATIIIAFHTRLHTFTKTSVPLIITTPCWSRTRCRL